MQTICSLSLWTEENFFVHFCKILKGRHNKFQNKCRKIFNNGAVLCILNEPVINYFQHVPSIWEDIPWCTDIPENELQHDVFTVQGEKSLEEAQ